LVRRLCPIFAGHSAKRSMQSMKTLHLLRHAKSSWKEPGLDDHERPLSKRGRAAASAIAKHMKRTAIAPDIVLCSTAVRTKETLEPIAKKLKLAKVIFEAGIYEVAENELWKHLGALPEQADTALMIGHNPGLHNLALALADTDSVGHLPPPEGKFPSGALATFSFEGRWRELRPRRAHHSITKTSGNRRPASDAPSVIQAARAPLAIRRRRRHLDEIRGWIVLPAGAWRPRLADRGDRRHERLARRASGAFGI